MLDYRIDNKYYQATIHLVLVENSPAVHEHQIVSDLIASAPAFVWSFTTPSSGAGQQHLPIGPVLGHLRDSHDQRELNFAIAFPQEADSTLVSPDEDVLESLEEVEWEYMESHALGELLESLQTIMWPHMARKAPTKPHSTATMRSPTSPDTCIQSDGQLGTERRTDGVHPPALGQEQDLLVEQADNDLETWLADEFVPNKSSASGPDITMPDPTTTVTPGFDDDFGPFHQSSPSTIDQDPADRSIDQLSALFSHLKHVKTELTSVENEDERRERAGREVEQVMRLLGM